MHNKTIGACLIWLYKNEWIFSIGHLFSIKRLKHDAFYFKSQI